MTTALIHKISVLCKEYYTLSTINDLFIFAGADRSWRHGSGSEFHPGNSQRIDCVYGWADAIRANVPTRLNEIFSQVAIQLIDDERISDGDRRFLKRQLEQLEQAQSPFLATVQSVAISNSFQLEKYVARINASIDSDPEFAVGSAKEMVESVLKTIVEGFGESVDKDDLPKLLKRCQKLLKLDPTEVDPDTKGADRTKIILSNLGQIVAGINELRNLYGTGHGKVRRSAITSRHARLVVGSGATLVIFLMETYEYQKGKQASDQ